MTAFPSAVDVAVIGAGAAGIGAARRLAQQPRVSVVVLEARDRVGGRVWTVERDGMPLDLGAEWLHSADRNPLTALAETVGFSVHRKLPDWVSRLRRSGESAAAEAEWLAVREAHYWALHRAASGPEDRAASAVLDPGERWNPLLDAISTWANGVELEHLSLLDHDRYEDSGVNWRVREGYGRLFARLAEGLPVALGTTVSRIDHRGRDIRIDTSRGAVTAARAIVTLPTSLLAVEAPRFDPVLPDKIAAAAGLPLGLADKLFLGFDGRLPGIEDDAHLVGSTHRRETMSYQVRPFGRPLIQCFFGGDFAAAMERDGMAGMAAFAAEELSRLFGAEIRRRLSPLAASAWRGDAFARGSYSYARPGHADDRARLAEPVDERLFFAGEACSAYFFSTAHGAFETGVAAAEAALRSLPQA
ncbi:MAG: FAD-dependent oxidoreductase [Alphaproteobacteria bacterium]|nr:FAD-dependent oxidoreductase [Alphaproteobacteria bacterium]